MTFPEAFLENWRDPTQDPTGSSSTHEGEICFSLRLGARFLAGSWRDSTGSSSTHGRQSCFSLRPGARFLAAPGGIRRDRLRRMDVKVASRLGLVHVSWRGSTGSPLSRASELWSSLGPGARFLAGPWWQSTGSPVSRRNEICSSLGLGARFLAGSWRGSKSYA